jgi:hypothetical protein
VRTQSVGDDMCGGKNSVSSRSVAMVMSLLGFGRAHRGLLAIT